MECIPPLPHQYITILQGMNTIHIGFRMTCLDFFLNLDKPLAMDTMLQSLSTFTFKGSLMDKCAHASSAPLLRSALYRCWSLLSTSKNLFQALIDSDFKSFVSLKLRYQHLEDRGRIPPGSTLSFILFFTPGSQSRYLRFLCLVRLQ